MLLADIDGAFNLTWIASIPLLVVLWGIMRKHPPAMAIVSGSVVALVIAVTVQGIPVARALSAAVGGVSVDMLNTPQPPGPGFLTLVQRGGLEDSVTITEPLMPWTVSAIFMATTLGVPTAQYAPWAMFCYGGPVFSLLIAATYRRTRFGIKPSGGSAPER